MTKKLYIAGRSEIPATFTVGASEELEITLVILPGIDCEIPLTVDLTGEGASVLLRGLYLCNARQKVSITVEVNHRVPLCTSRQQFRGIAGGESDVSFFGKILVAKDAQKTKAYQENHNILTSDKATAQTKPQLEIYADDVECSHGATVGSLDANERFYMQSRGIPEEEARVLQMISFISPIADSIEDNTIRTEIYEDLSKC